MIATLLLVLLTTPCEAAPDSQACKAWERVQEYCRHPETGASIRPVMSFDMLVDTILFEFGELGRAEAAGIVATVCDAY